MTGLATDVAEFAHEPAQSSAPAWVRRHPHVLVLACYLLGGFYVTSHLWINAAGRRQTGDIQDVNQATWFLRYAATAIEHFRLPALTTTAMNAPHGVNMMWNTSMLLPGAVVTPVTLLFGPQVSLTLLLVLGFAGSSAAMFYVLRHWRASLLAAALGGALYGFSPALVSSGFGHYSLVLAMIPPLLVDRVLRIVTGDAGATRNGAVRNGLWLGALTAAQLFISEEALVDTCIAAVIFLAVLAVIRPREITSRLRQAALGLAVAAAAALVLAGRGLWVQFHGIAAHGASLPVVIHYQHRLTNLGTLPYAFVTPSNGVVLHTTFTAHSAARYPQPFPEYLAYLGIPLIILLLAAVIYFWRNVTIRAAGITCLLLEWLGLGAKPLVPHAGSLPSFLLPWQYLQHLPVFASMIPDRLCILADAAAAVVLAYALDQARGGARHFGALKHGPLKHGGQIAAGAVVAALLFVLPAPYIYYPVGQPPAGWQATFKALNVGSDQRVMLAPFPWAGTSQVMRWVADSGQPATMIGGDFIAAGQSGSRGRAGRAGLTPTANYINALYAGEADVPEPSASQIKTDLAAMKPAFVVAATDPSTPLAAFLVRVFGPPTTATGTVLGWRLAGDTAGVYGS